MADSLVQATGALQPGSQAEAGTRKVIAPPGKLGIVVDSAEAGPTVFKIKDFSPLKGVLFEGDILLAIDDVNTKGMSAAEISAVMAKKGGAKRTLTVK